MFTPGPARFFTQSERWGRERVTAASYQATAVSDMDVARTEATLEGERNNTKERITADGGLQGGETGFKVAPRDPPSSSSSSCTSPRADCRTALGVCPRARLCTRRGSDALGFRFPRRPRACLELCPRRHVSGEVLKEAAAAAEAASQLRGPRSSPG